MIGTCNRCEAVRELNVDRICGTCRHVGGTEDAHEDFGPLIAQLAPRGTSVQFDLEVWRESDRYVLAVLLQAPRYATFERFDPSRVAGCTLYHSPACPGHPFTLGDLAYHRENAESIAREIAPILRSFAVGDY